MSLHFTVTLLDMIDRPIEGMQAYTWRGGPGWEGPEDIDIPICECVEYDEALKVVQELLDRGYDPDVRFSIHFAGDMGSLIDLDDFLAMKSTESEPVDLREKPPVRSGNGPPKVNRVAPHQRSLFDHLETNS
jgi:hypothetical protein